jgi:hypothetical protein
LVHVEVGTMAVDRNPQLTVPVKTSAHYTECEPWCTVNIGGWNEAWWRDFPDMAISVVLGQVPQPETYWFTTERDALMFTLRFA